MKTTKVAKALGGVLLGVALMAAQGCGGDDDAVTVDAGPADASTAIPDGGPMLDGPISCNISGTYTLETISCAGTDITAAFKARIPTTSVLITASAQGGCRVQLTYSSGACQEIERFTVIGLGSNVTATYQGITSCMPDMCTFGSGDAPCMVGDRSGAHTGVTIAFEGAKLRINEPTSGLCQGQAVSVLLNR